MDSLSAFAQGEANRGRPSMVFDWHKAATLIREECVESASAGLRGDWEWTGGAIFSGGEPLSRDETYTYLASTWAVPEIEINGELVPCFIMKDDSPGWDADTYWPQSALDILKAT